jgi:hypothetical protein
MKMSRGQPSWRRLIRWTHGTFSGLHFLRQRSNVSANVSANMRFVSASWKHIA